MTGTGSRRNVGVVQPGGLRFTCIRSLQLAAVLCLTAVLLAAAAAPAAAQECPDPPGNPSSNNTAVNCSKVNDSDPDVIIKLDNYEYNNPLGWAQDGVVYGDVQDAVTTFSDIDINVRNSTINAPEANDAGIYGYHAGGGGGNLSITTDSTSIVTKGPHAGILGSLSTTGAAVNGDLSITANRTTITAEGKGSGIHGESIVNGDLSITANRTTITAEGRGGGNSDTLGNGILAKHSGTGDVRISTSDVGISTSGGTNTTTKFGDGIRGEHSGLGKLSISSSGGNITTLNGHGIYGLHEGTGDLSLNANGTTITTKGEGHGIYGLHKGSGDLTIGTDGATIVTYKGHGIRAQHNDVSANSTTNVSSGNLTIDLRGGSITAGKLPDGVTTPVRSRHAVLAEIGAEIGTNDPNPHQGGDLRVRIRGTKIVASMGKESRGLLLTHNAQSGSIVADIRDATIEAEYEGTVADDFRDMRGIQAKLAGSKSGNVVIGVGNSTITVRGGNGIEVENTAGDATGKIDIDLFDRSKIETEGYEARGIYAHDEGSVDIEVDVHGKASIETRGLVAHGVYAEKTSSGDSGNIRLRIADGASVRTHDAEASGVYGTVGSGSTGDITIDVVGGAKVTTSGQDAHGVQGHKLGTGDITIAVMRGAEVSTSGSGAHGLYAYHENSGEGNFVIHIGGGSSVTATGQNASGVQVGKVIPNSVDMEWHTTTMLGDFRSQTVHVHGSVMGGKGDAAAGIRIAGGRVFIGPGGTVGAASGISIRTPASALYLGLDPNGRSMSEVLRGGKVRNDGGHKCSGTPCVGGTTIVMNGVELHNRETGTTRLWGPNGAYDVRLEADFSDNEGNDFSGADFTSRFAARSTVYEALPGFLLRIDGPGSVPGARERRSGDPSGWGWVSGASGSFKAKHSTVGARYDHDSFAMETGRTFRLGEGLHGSLGLRMVKGSADAKSSTGEGTLDAQGQGLSAGLEWSDGAGTSIAARATATRYDLDLGTTVDGALAGNVSASVRSLRVEARRLSGDDRFELRGWLHGWQASVDGFTDVKNARVSAVDEGRLVAGASVSARGALELAGGDAVILRGSLGFESLLDGKETAVSVGVTPLRSSAPANRVLLDLEAVHPLGETGSVGVGLRVQGLGSRDRHVAASGNLSFRF